MAFVVGRVVKLVGSGIGLGREAYLYNKEKKALKASAGPSLAVTSPGDEDVYLQMSNEDADALVARGEAVDVTDDKSLDVKLRELDIDSDVDYDSLEEDDEQDWELDEAANPPSYDEAMHEKQRSASVGTLVHEVMPHVQASSAAIVPTARLPYPVIIPQRRPGTKGRGFVHAYAPDLEACGIDQTTFLKFIENFHEASQASPVFKVLFVAAGIAGMVPSAIAMAVTISVQVAAKTASEIQGRYRTNTYLDEINKELFMPRGLYAMVVIYKAEPAKPHGWTNDEDYTEIEVESYDMMTSKAIARYASTDGVESASKMKTKMKTLRLSSGVSKGEKAMPTTCAPLIFPGLDAMATPSDTLSPQETLSPQTTHNSSARSTSPRLSPASPSPSASAATTPQEGKFKRAGKFMSDYFDRRAQANYIAANPNSTLATSQPPPQFRSRFADPTHAASNGHIANLVTGGAANMRNVKQRKMQRREIQDRVRMARGRDPRWDESGRRIRRDGMPKSPVGLVLKGVKKVLTEDVMYLMIVNMPTESEMKEARQAMEDAN